MSDFLKDIIKETGNEYATLVSDGVESADVTSFIDTGSYSFNALLSGSIYGGMPGNKITAIAGEAATGKTFFALGIVKHFLDTEFYHRMRWKYGMPDFISGTLIANRENNNRVGASGCDMMFEHTEGSWMVNSKELEYIREKHKEFYDNGRKYPDEN